jgi:hypothetical protein
VFPDVLALANAIEWRKKWPLTTRGQRLKANSFFQELIG